MPIGPYGIGAAGALLAFAGWLLYRRRLRRYTEADTALDDALIRRIEREGRVEVEDPTDQDEVRAEEERFWGETWDRPEEL